MRVAQCYTDKQTNIILVLALRTVILIMGLSPKRRIPQSSVRSASTNIIFVCFSMSTVGPYGPSGGERVKVQINQR